ncbi:MAG: carboxypeptidase-like regulatory domain-containing protein [Acidobacteriota bacterium]
MADFVVSGVVVDGQGKPLGGVSVSARTPDLRELKEPDAGKLWPPVVLQELVTNAEGRFAVEGNELLYFDLRFEKDGYFNRHFSWKSTDFGDRGPVKIDQHRVVMTAWPSLPPRVEIKKAGAWDRLRGPSERRCYQVDTEGRGVWQDDECAKLHNACLLTMSLRLRDEQAGEASGNAPEAVLEVDGAERCGIQLASYVEGLPRRYQFLTPPSDGYGQQVMTPWSAPDGITCFFRSASDDYGYFRLLTDDWGEFPVKFHWSHRYAPGGEQSLYGYGDRD